MDVWTSRTEKNQIVDYRIATAKAHKHRHPEMRMPRGGDMVHEGRQRPAEESGQDVPGAGKSYGIPMVWHLIRTPLYVIIV